MAAEYEISFLNKTRAGNDKFWVNSSPTGLHESQFEQYHTVKKRTHNQVA